MGISSDWRKLLIERYQNCFHRKLPNGVVIDKAIDDFTSDLFKFIYLAKSYDEIMMRYKSHVSTNVEMSQVEEYVLLIDEYSTKNKAPKKRAEEIKAQEIKDRKIRVPGGAFPTEDPARLLSTPCLKRDLCKWLIYNISSSKKKEDTTRVESRDCKITVDGAPSFTDSNGEVTMILRKYFAEREKNYDRENYLYIDSTKNIGESDLKVLHHIQGTQPGKNVLVMNLDGDLIPIILLNMRDWIDPATGEIPFTVWLHFSHDQKSIHELHSEEETRKQKNRRKMKEKKDKEKNANDNDNQDPMEIDPNDLIDLPDTAEPAPEKGKPECDYCLINMNELFKDICINFKEEFGISQGVVVLAILIMIDGTDFTTGLDTVGVNKIWKAFVNDGYKILSGSAITVPVGRNSTKTLVPEQKVYNIDQHVLGDPMRLHNVWFNEERICMFYRYILFREIGGSDVRINEIPKCKELKELKEKKDKNKKPAKQSEPKLGKDGKPVKPRKPRNPLPVPSEAELTCYARRIWWNQVYWMLGSKSRLISGVNATPNPLEKKNGVSVWGWDLGADMKPFPATSVTEIV
jgi:hypothetical protein